MLNAISVALSAGLGVVAHNGAAAVTVTVSVVVDAVQPFEDSTIRVKAPLVLPIVTVGF